MKKQLENNEKFLICDNEFLINNLDPSKMQENNYNIMVKNLNEEYYDGSYLEDYIYEINSHKEDVLKDYIQIFQLNKKDNQDNKKKTNILFVKKDYVLNEFNKYKKEINLQLTLKNIYYDEKIKNKFNIKNNDLFNLTFEEFISLFDLKEKEYQNIFGVEKDMKIIDFVKYEYFDYYINIQEIILDKIYKDSNKKYISEYTFIAFVDFVLDNIDISKKELETNKDFIFKKLYENTEKFKISKKMKALNENEYNFGY